MCLTYENNVKMETNNDSTNKVKYHLDMFFYRCCEILSRTVGSVGDTMIPHHSVNTEGNKNTEGLFQ